MKELMNICVKEVSVYGSCLLNIIFYFPFLPNQRDICPHGLPRTHTRPQMVAAVEVGVSLRSHGPSYLSWVSSPSSFCPLLVLLLVLACNVAAAQLMLCDRRRENRNCLALVSRKVIYFQKLTESHCRGFIYFYSECHCSVMQGT